MLEIRLAVPVDVDAIRECVSEAFGVYLTRLPLPPAAMLADYESLVSQDAVFVAVDPEVVGTVTVTGQGSDLVVTNLAVGPSRQGTGVGRALMRFVERFASEAGYQRVTLYTHELMSENIAFYGRLGYVETGRRVTDGRSRVYFARDV